MGIAWSVLLCVGAGQAYAQTPPVPEVPAQPAVVPHIIFSRDWPSAGVPKVTFEVDRNGRGTYIGAQALPAVRGAATSPAAQPFSRTFSVSATTADRIFALAQQAGHFNVNCASKAKNIADTGSKTLSYAGPDGAGSCTYNYSEDRAVTELAALLQGIMETMDTGRELDRLHRYDRLGLDDAMASLAQEVSDGRALELGTIAPSLHSIAADTEVMLRVRTRAAALLKLIPPDAATR